MSAELEAWTGDPVADRVVALARDYRLLVPIDAREHAPHLEGDLDALLAGARLLPPALTRPDDPIIRVVFHEQARPYGLGDGSAAAPDLESDTHTFHLYEVSDHGEDRALFRLERMTPAQRRRLWRMRAAVHMIVRRADRRARFSGARRWRLINLWDEGDPTSRSRHARNLDAWGYSRARGAESPHLDFVTFAEEYLVAASDFGEDLVPPDDSIFCQELSKARVLESVLRSVDGSWTRAFPQPRPHCEVLEDWIDQRNVAGIEIVMAAASTVKVESMFGHLYVHIVPKDPERGPSFDRYYQFMALIGDDVGRLWYLIKGVFGGFPTIFVPSNLDLVTHQTVMNEHRTLRHYRLDLSDEEVRRVMERIWEVERRHLYSYRFTSQNCATFVIDLLAPAIDAQAPAPSDLGAFGSPTAVLDALASASTERGAPLLVYEPPDFYSDEELAQLAAREVRALRPRLRAQDPDAYAAWRRIQHRLTSADPDVRHRGYGALDRWVAESLAPARAVPAGFGGRTAPGLDPRDALRLMELQIRTERLAVNLTEARAERIRLLARRGRPPRIRTDELIAWRRELYRREIPAAERYAEVDEFIQRQRARWEALPPRELTEQETEDVERARRTRDAFRSLTASYATRVEQFAPDDDPFASWRREQAGWRADALQRDRLSVAGAVRMRFGVESGARFDANEGTRPRLAVSAHLIDEHLGTQRKRGFPADLELRLLNARVEASVNDGQPLLDAVEGTVLGFRTVRRKVGPVRRTLWDNFGWGTDIQAGHRPDLGQGFYARGRLGFYKVVAGSAHLEHFLVVGVALDQRFVWAGGDGHTLGGVNAEVLARAHLFGRYANALQLEVEGSPLTDVTHLSTHSTIQRHVRAQLGVDVLLAEPRNQPLILRPSVRLETTSLDYRNGAPRTDVLAGVALWY